MKPQNPQLYAIVGIIIGFIIIASAVPINNNIDIVTDVDIEFPYLTGIISDPKITSVNTEITSHTLFHLPSLATAGIITSDNIQIRVIGGGNIKRVTESLGTSDTYTIILPNVPPTTDKITVELYYKNKKVDTKEVSLT